MTGKVIEYTSAQKTVYTGTEQVLETSEKDGIKCVWSGTVVPAENHAISFKWIFDAENEKIQKIDRITGHIIVKCAYNWFSPFRVEVNLDENNNTVSAKFGSGYGAYDVTFEYNLTVHYEEIEKKSYEEMFAPSETNDIVLIVEDKKIHVNKAFLSCHSDFFRALFSSNFKEKQLTEIPIEEVTYEDFGLLMSTISPICRFPNDKTAEKLLELADRFLMPSVTHHVEHHLLRLSQLSNAKKLSMADKYGMEKLLNHSIRQIESVSMAQELKKTPEYVGLSDRTKAMILDTILH